MKLPEETAPTTKPESPLTRRAREIREARSKETDAPTPVESPTHEYGEQTPDLPLTVEVNQSEVSTAAPLDPAWDAVREVAGQLRSVGRLFLRGQVRLGMMLLALKKEIGIHRGQPKKKSPESGEYFSWGQIVKEQTGYSRQAADEFIRLFEATKAKLKRAKHEDLPASAKSDALALFHAENPLALTPEQWETVDTVIASLTCGETQAGLMIELGVLPKPRAMPKGGGGKPDDDITAGQLAFHFFDAAMAPLFNARTSPDYKKLLLALPAYSTEEEKISLDLISSECRAVLADIAEVLQALAKPAKGRVV